MPTVDEFARDTIRAHVDIEMRLAERVQRLEGALRRAMGDPLNIIDHAYRPAPRESFADIIVEKPHRPGCLRCEIETLLGASIPNATERYREMLSRPTSEGQKP